MAVMAREAWTDERLDDLSQRVDAGFARVATEIRDLRGEVKTQGKELRGEIKSQGGELRGEIRGLGVELRAETQEVRGEMNARFDALQRTMLQVGGGLVGAIVVGFLGLIATQL